MGKDWTKVFGNDMCNRLTSEAVKTFAGYDPQDEKDCVQFGKHLGITAYGVDCIKALLGRPEIEVELLPGDESEEEEGESTEPAPSGRKKSKRSDDENPKRWDASKMHKDLRTHWSEEDFHGRAKVLPRN